MPLPGYARAAPGRVTAGPRQEDKDSTLGFRKVGGKAARRGRYRAVLIDALGTLVRLEPPAPALRAELGARGFEVTEAEAEAGAAAEIQHYLAHQLDGRDRESLEDLRASCAEAMRAALPGGDGLDPVPAREAMLAALRFTAFEDAAPALAELRAGGVRIVAVSNWDCSLDDVLESLGLLDALDGAVASAVVGAAKPDPAPFARALELAGAAPAEALHVGDSPVNDVEGAHAAGIDAALLVRSGAPPPDVDAGVIKSLSEVSTLVFPPR